MINHVFVMNVVMIQTRNGYNLFYFALDSTFRGQAYRGLQAEAK